jgi:hypothetical protein
MHLVGYLYEDQILPDTKFNIKLSKSYTRREIFWNNVLE